MTLRITIDPVLNGLGLVGDTFRAAVGMAVQMLSTDKYCSVLIENISDETKPNVAEVRTTINSMDITVSTIQIGEHMDAYALVYRDNSENNIYINPLLLMQIRRMEIGGATAEYLRKCSLFLAAKIVHELSHLIQPKISPKLTNQVKKRALGGEGKRKMQTPEKSKGGAKFSDFGEMVEYDIFGGILEIYTAEKQPVAYLIDELILYEHPTARIGSIVIVKATDYTVSPTLDDFVLTKGGNVDKPYKGPRGHLGVSVRFSAPGAAAESDIIGGEEVDTLEPTY